MDRFITNFERLSKSVQNRLTIENDDKASMYSVKDLMYIHNKIKFLLYLIITTINSIQVI
jgi:UV DNA damage endonuclease